MVADDQSHQTDATACASMLSYPVLLAQYIALFGERMDALDDLADAKKTIAVYEDTVASLRRTIRRQNAALQDMIEDNKAMIKEANEQT